MDLELITIDEISSLPDDPQAAFVTFESICRRRLHQIISESESGQGFNDYYLDYMARVSAAAREYGIEDSDKLKVPLPSGFGYEDYRRFNQAVVTYVTRLQIRSVQRLKESSVELRATDKQKLEHHIRNLRDRVENSELSDEKKKALLRKIDDLMGELSGKRLNLARTMIIAASIMTLINQTESAIIKMPETLSAIVQVIGLAKESEEQQRISLPPSAKRLAIEAKSGEEDADIKESREKTFDDEIPF